jgi:glycosyltransferase involved in cell wall biosynthesis
LSRFDDSGDAMRVLLAHKYFRLVGGAESFFFETGRLLQESGHDVAYFSTQHPHNQHSDFARYFVRSYDYNSSQRGQQARALATAVYSREAKRSMRQLIDDFRPDVVHLFGIFTQISTSVIDACAEASVPVVISCNDYKHICPNYKLYHHNRLCDDCRSGHFYKAALNRCCHESLAFSVASMLEAYSDRLRGTLRGKVDLFLFASEFMAEMTSTFWGEGTFKWRLLRNPFTPSLLSTRPERDHGDYVLYFGRLIEEKGVDQLLRAAGQLPGVAVRIVGDGPCEDALRRQAAAADLSNVQFCGPLWGSAMDDMLRDARAVVVPSLWHENFPYVILQAFAAGKPVIGSDRGGIPGMIEHGSRGIVYPADDPDMLADAVRKLWADPEICEHMGRAARHYVVSEYGAGSFMRSLMAAYEAVLA